MTFEIMKPKKTKKILLHICCAPCATHVHHWLETHGWKVTGYFYNPNIHPFREYDRRLINLKLFAAVANFPLICDEAYELEEFLKLTLGKKEKRCLFCYWMRLEQTALYAKKKKFKYFTTTLLVSPFQKHDWLLLVAQAIARKHGVEFYYHDFRKGWNESVRMSKQMNLYRQPYCGCVFSERERFRGAERGARSSPKIRQASQKLLRKIVSV